MAEGYGWRSRDEWGQTALLATILANANRDPKKRRRPYTIDDFDPYANRRKTKRRAVSKGEWKAVGRSLKTHFEKKK